MSNNITIRQYNPYDAQNLANIYYNTVHNINSKDYSEKQINAWATPSTSKAENWIEKWEKLIPIVAQTDCQVVGFVELEKNGYIDCFYVHHKYQNCGVGSALMNAVFDKAKSLQIKVIYAEVSITAKPFFKSKGFKVIKKQIVKLRGVELTNYLMEIQNRKF